MLFRSKRFQRGAECALKTLTRLDAEQRQMSLLGTARSVVMAMLDLENVAIHVFSDEWRYDVYQKALDRLLRDLIAAP